MLVRGNSHKEAEQGGAESTVLLGFPVSRLCRPRAGIGPDYADSGGSVPGLGIESVTEHPP